jgi:hypothetical protein
MNETLVIIFLAIIGGISVINFAVTVIFTPEELTRSWNDCNKTNIINITENITLVTNNVTFFCNCSCNFTCEKDYQELPLFLQEFWTVANARKYDNESPDRYVCMDYSHSLHQRLINDGYKDSYFCIGISLKCMETEKDKDKCRHAWNKIGNTIILDATWQFIPTPEEYKEYYEEEFCYNDFRYESKYKLAF